MQHVPPEWVAQLDMLTAEGGDEAAHDQWLFDQLAQADPDLLAFLVDQLAGQETPQAAAALEILAANAAAPEAVRSRARAAVDELADKGITAPPPGEERFYAGWVQRGRERGEQILILGWRMPSGTLEALVFLLDWRGDGLKDFYATRGMIDAEWRELVSHNAQKGAPLVEVSLAEGRALLDAALAESRRFSRPLPREYKRENGLIARRVIQAIEPSADPRSFITPDLSPEEVVSAYVAALHYRDYTLAAELLAPEHPQRAGRAVSETASSLRDALKHAPRRRMEVQTQRLSGDDDGMARINADGSEVRVEPSGRRVESPTYERYTLRQLSQTWRITHTGSGAQRLQSL
jgi:hypothetical protein